MNWLNKILGREQTLEQLVAEQQELGRKVDALRDKRKVLAAKINEETAKRAPAGMTVGTVAKGN